MDNTLALLDQKITQLIALLDETREQHGQLNARLATAEARCHDLESQMNTARSKLEHVVAKLPD